MSDSSEPHEAPLDHQLEPPEHEELLAPPSADIEPDPVEDEPVTENSLNGMAGIEPPDIAMSAPAAIIHPESVAAISSQAAAESGTLAAELDAPATLPDLPPASSGRSRKKKMTLLLAGVVAAVVVLGGGAAAAYYGYVLPNKPQNVVARAFMHEFSGGSSQSGKIEGDLTYSSSKLPVNLGTTTFSGDIDGKTGFDATINLSVLTFKPSLSLASVDGQTVYGKLSGLGNAQSVLGPLLQSAGASSPTSSSTQLLGSILPMLSTINDKWFYSPAPSTPTLGSSDLQTIASIYKKHMFIVAGKKLGSETIDGQKSTHYQVTLGNKQLKDFLLAVKNAKLRTLPLSQSDYDNLNKAIDAHSLSAYPLDFWITSNLDIAQFKFSQTTSSGTSSFRIALKDRGTAVTIQKPSGSLPLATLIAQINGISSPDATPKGLSPAQQNDQTRKTDIRGIQTALAQYYAAKGVYPTSLAQITGLPASLCQAPGGSGTCAKPDFGYHAYKKGSPIGIDIPTNCSATVACTEYTVYVDSSVSAHSAMEAESNPYSVTNTVSTN